jgi:DNA polymerase III alpha subunit (gram-positive type)
MEYGVKPKLPPKPRAVKKQKIFQPVLRNPDGEVNNSLALVFDTETTGFFPKTSESDLNLYPYLLQISLILVHKDTCSIIQIYNKYIRIDSNVIIPSKITEITGITKEMCESPESVPIEEALYEFYKFNRENESVPFFTVGRL